MKQFCKVRLTFIFYDVILVAKLALHFLRGGTLEYSNKRATKREEDFAGAIGARGGHHAANDHLDRGREIHRFARVGL